MSRARTPEAAVLAVAVAAAALWSAYLASDLSPPVRAAPAERIRIALPATPDAALLHIASVNGYLQAEGLDATILRTTHGKAALALLADGKADVAAAADAPFLVAAMQGADLRFAASISTTVDEGAVVARRDYGIRAPAHLADMRIGVTFGTSGDYFLRAFLIRNRIPLDSVTLVDVAPTAIAHALAQGSVDAVATWHPIVGAAEQAVGARGASFSLPGTNTTAFLVVLRGDFLQRQPKAAEGLVRALLRAEAFARERPDEALDLIAAQLGADHAALRPVLRNFVLKVQISQSQLATLEAQSRWAMARGFAPPGPVPNVLPYAYLDALLAVDAARVTVIR